MIDHHATIGFPGIANGALWGNVLLMPFAIFIIGSYWDQWSREGMVIAFSAGALLAFFAFTVFYRYGLHDDAWAGADEIHPAGIVAMVYTAGLVAGFILFYAYSDAKLEDVWIITGLLALYMPVANHLVLDALNGYRQFVWCPQIFKEETRPLLIFVWGEVFVAGITALKLFFPKAWL